MARADLACNRVTIAGQEWRLQFTKAPPGKACCQLLMEKRLIRIWRGGAGDTAAGIIEAIDHVWRQLTKTDEVQLRRIAASN
jgi:hypothetical protein